MSIGILGKKLGMSQFFDEQGRAVPVTLIEAGPCRITQIKNNDTDGYSAVQIGFGDTREKLINKPVRDTWPSQVNPFFVISANTGSTPLMASNWAVMSPSAISKLVRKSMSVVTLSVAVSPVIRSATGSAVVR